MNSSIRFRVAAVPIAGLRHRQAETVFRSDSTTWRPISSCTSKTFSSTKSCCSEEMLFCVIASKRCIETRQCAPSFWTFPCKRWRIPRSRHARAGSVPAA